MDNLLSARSQMGMSLAFHIIFATIGVSLPLMVTIAEWRWRSPPNILMDIEITVAFGAVILIPSLAPYFSSSKGMGKQSQQRR